MKTELTEVAPCRVRLEIELPAERVDTAFEEAYATLQNQVQLKGFRKGHAPRRMIERRFSRDVATDVRNKLFQEALVAALKENDLSPLGDPDVDIESLEVQPGQPFGFGTEVDVRPKFDLPEYKGLKLEEKFEPASDEMIDERIERMRESFATNEPVEGAAEVGDILYADVRAEVGGEELFAVQDDSVRVKGERLFGFDIPGLEEKLAGAQPDDEIALDFAVPEDYHEETACGKTAKVTIKVRRIERPQIPPLDEEFAKRVGFDSVEGFRQRIREIIEADSRAGARRELEREAVDKLIESSEFDLPEEFLLRHIKAETGDRLERLEQMGAGAEFIAERREEIEKASGESSERNIRRMILFDAIAEKEEIEIGQNDLQQHIQRLAERYHMTPAKMLKQIQQHNLFSLIGRDIRDLKVSELLLEHAEIAGHNGGEAGGEG